MIHFIRHYPWECAIGVYWILSAAVSAMPEPDAKTGPGYLWLYRFSHTIAGNVKTVLGSKIPGLK